MPIATRVIAASVALGLGLTLTVGACSSNRTPAELRHDKVQARLQDTFTDAQARCIMAKLDPATLRALAVGNAALTGTPATTYSNAVVACVTGATVPAATTSAPAATSSTTPGTTTSKP